MLDDTLRYYFALGTDVDLWNVDHKRERYNTVHCIKLTNKMFQEFQTFGGCCLIKQVVSFL